MTLSRRRLLLAAALGLAHSRAQSATLAASQPVQRVCRIVVGFPPGGSTDVIARRLARRMSGSYAAFVVDNKPGAGGRIALEHLRASEGDGATLVLTPHPMVTIYPHVYRRLSYDPLRDFTPVTSVCTTVASLSIGPAVPESVRTIEDFIGWCKANPDLAAYGSAGAGTTPHFTGQMLARAAGIRYTHVPYAGSAPVIQAVIGGHVASGVTGLVESLPPHKGRRLRIIAITGTARSRFVPDVPTLKEAGLQHVEVPAEWFGVFVSAKTPVQLVVELNAAVRAALGDAQVQRDLEESACEVAGEPAPDFARRVEDDHRQWGRIVRASGFTIDE